MWGHRATKVAATATKPACAGWRVGCLLIVLPALVLVGGALWAALAQPLPGELIYPGAVPSGGPDAGLLGLYGSYETPDSVDQVTAWYAQHGLPGTPTTLGGTLASVSGSRGQATRLPIPATRNGLHWGRALAYSALTVDGRTLISLWCVPACPPTDMRRWVLTVGP
ncbi:MAG: hypothetical protein M3Z04_14870 [Chloroflexota bacterium]|nr:hypothetical protein [Chloroflexota bacterium]